ncbi:DUF1636 domain-containing protein [Acetobacteraceae bacterium KSS8]|uniref:DUF1636 domain-containing protein n=1 Tax=Endosaccharibacter trunci TaxID=2812733 RepID=A0ABT1W2L6_9PROT|nr:DUF1636 domain-containing protein [Acetobacteraceae bacterium KSS8]
MRDESPIPVLHVCTSCRAGTELSPRPGRVLHDRLRALGSPDLHLIGVECLAVCNDGCSAAISMPGKWTYLIGRLTPDKAEDIAAFATAYRASKTGTVMPSKRPASLADMVLGRVPALPLPEPAR